VLSRAVRYFVVPVAATASALTYALALVGVHLVFQTRTAATRSSWLDWASTSLDSLATHPVGSLLASAFVTEDDPLAWAGLALVGLWSAVRVLDAGRRVPWNTLIVLLGVHVLATVLSEGLLARRIALGYEPASARRLLDVGPSYVVVCALVVALVAGRGLERIACAAGFVVVAPSLFEGLDRWDVTAVGHAGAVLLAAGYGLWRRPRIRRREPRPAR
jgi:hypothetical protein